MPFAKCGYFYPNGKPRVEGGCTRLTDCNFVHPDSPDWNSAPEPRKLPRGVPQSQDPNNSSPSSRKRWGRGKSPPTRAQDDFVPSTSRAPKGPKGMRAVTAPEPSSFDSSSWGLPSSSSNSIPRSASLRNFEGGWDTGTSSNKDGNSSWASLWSSAGRSTSWGDCSANNDGWGASTSGGWGESTGEGWGANASGGWGDSTGGGWGDSTGDGWGTSGSSSAGPGGRDKSLSDGWSSSTTTTKDNKDSRGGSGWGSTSHNEDVPRKAENSGWTSINSTASSDNKWPSSKPTVASNVPPRSLEPVSSARRRDSGSLISPTTPNASDTPFRTISNTRSSDYSRAIHPPLYTTSSRQSSIVSDVATTRKLATPIIPPLTPMADSVITKLVNGPKEELKAKTLELFSEAVYVSLQIDKLHHSIDQLRRMNASPQFGHVSQAARHKLSLVRKNYDKSLAEQKVQFAAALENLSRLPDLASLDQISETDARRLMAYAVELCQWMTTTRHYVVALASSFSQEREEIVASPTPLNVEAAGIPLEAKEDIDPSSRVIARARSFDSHLDDLSYRIEDGMNIDTRVASHLDTLKLPDDKKPTKLLELEQKIVVVDAEFKAITDVAATLVETHAAQQRTLNGMKQQVTHIQSKRQDFSSKHDEVNQLHDTLMSQLKETTDQVRNMHVVKQADQPHPPHPDLPFTAEQIQEYADFVVNRLVDEELRPAILEAHRNYLEQIKASTTSIDTAALRKLKPIASIARVISETSNATQNVNTNKSTVL